MGVGYINQVVHPGGLWNEEGQNGNEDVIVGLMGISCPAHLINYVILTNDDKLPVALSSSSFLKIHL